MVPKVQEIAMHWRLIVTAGLLWQYATAYNLETSETFTIYLRNGGSSGGNVATQEPAYAGYSFNVKLENNTARIIVGQPRSGEPDRVASPGALYRCDFKYLGNQPTTTANYPATSTVLTNVTATDSPATTEFLTTGAAHSTDTITEAVSTENPEGPGSGHENDTTTTPSTTATSITVATSKDFSSPNCTKIDIYDKTNLQHRNADQTTDADAIGLSIGRLGNTDDYAVCTPLRVKACPNTLSFSPGACYVGNPQDNYWNFMKWNEPACFDSTIEIIFAVDGSSSIKLANFVLVKNWVVSVITALIDAFGESVRTEVLQFSDNDKRYKKIPIEDSEKFKIPYTLNDGLSIEQITERITNMEYLNQTTYTYYALRRVMEVEFPRSPFYTTSRKILVVLTDGEANDGAFLGNWFNNHKDIVTPFAVGVGDYSKFLHQLRAIANGNQPNLNMERVLTVERFDQLQSVVANLTSSITSSASAEGSSGSSGNDTSKDVSSPQMGTSISSGQDGAMYFGSVGMYMDTGMVMKYDSANTLAPDIPLYHDLQTILPARTEDSYMGYSVVTGFFDGNGSSEYVAAGAPRHSLLGAVVIYKPVKGSSALSDNVTVMAPIAKREVAAYFGGSLLSIDVSGDGKDDLFIGAPLYVEKTYDEGRVFVYISQAANSSQIWASTTYTPHELTGDKSSGGRFGTAMANAGDLNLDGYNDVVIGAPLADGGQGAVFIYHGRMGGIENEPSQIIHASTLGSTLKYFGQSLQGNIDVDDNQYPDIFVGAPKSDSVVVLRSRPIVKISASVQFTTPSIDIFDCISKGYKNCTEIKVCFLANGTSIESSIGMRFNLTLDTGKTLMPDRRLEFQSSATVLSEEIRIDTYREQCFIKALHMKKEVKDYESVVNVTLEFDLLSSHVAVPFSSVRDPIPTTSSNAKTYITFAKECDNDTCMANLQLRAELILPPFAITRDGVATDYTENGTVLVIHPSTASVPITVKVNFTNKGESAFETRLRATYPTKIALSTVTHHSADPPSKSCVVEDGSPVTIGNGMTTQAYRYNYEENIMRPNAWCYFEFNVVTDNLKNDGTTEKFTLNVTIFTDSSSSIENDTSDNSWEATTAVKYRSDLTLKKVSSDGEIPFNYTTDAENITSVSDIGRNTSNLEMAFRITGTGYSNIPSSQIMFKWPWMTQEGNPLLYLFQLDCTAHGSSGGDATTCVCDQTKINPFNLTDVDSNENSTVQATVYPANEPMYVTQLNCTEIGPETNHTCEFLTCHVGNLGASEEILFRAKFRLWTPSIRFEGTNNTHVDLTSYFEISTADSSLILNNEGSNVTLKSVEIITNAKKYIPRVNVETQNLLWIYILAATGGLLILVVIVIILWRCGFFTNEYKKKLDQKKAKLDDETDYPGTDEQDIVT